MKNNFKLLIIISFGIILVLSSNLEAIRASSTSDIKLPDFVQRYLKYVSRGNETYLAQITSQLIENQKIQQERIESTKGAVLHPPNGSQLDTSTFSFMAALRDPTPTSPNETYGYVQDEAEMIGGTDNSFTHLHTDDWNHDEDHPMGGEAFVFGKWYGTWASGDFWVYAKKGPDSTSEYSNYIMFSVCNGNPYNYYNWEYIGYRQVTSTTTYDYYMGTSYNTWEWLSVQCWTPPPYPVYYEPLAKNCVLIDAVCAWNWYE
jgi:hypothetical protein